MSRKSGNFWEWFYPFAFVVCAGWVVWHMPAFILDLIPPEGESITAQLSGLLDQKDVTPNLAGPFGGRADFIDWIALILMPITFALGMRSVVVAPMEFQYPSKIDMVAMFIGRITMILIISMTFVMLYEVFLRYVIEAPTLWANELTLWIAGFIFMLSGIYAMQQRCHIRIFILYDIMPRWAQHLCDTLWVFLFGLFAFFMVFGSYKQIFVTKFYRWQTFGTAFDPPIPATIQPMILIVICLIFIQACLNLVADWNRDPDDLMQKDAVDQEELEALKKSAGAN